MSRYVGNHELAQNPTVPSVHLSQLPSELLSSVFSKMRFPSFLNSRMACRWIHDFIKDFRSQINVQYHCELMSMEPNVAKRIRVLKNKLQGLYLKCGYKKLHLPLKELMAIRPQRVRIHGWFERKIGKLVYWKPRKIKRAISVLGKLGWLSGEVDLSDLKENELWIACDEILKHSVPTKLEISRYKLLYGTKISKHPLLFLAPTVYLCGCLSPDYAFILGNHKKIVVWDCDDICTSSVNKMIKNIVSCSVPIEQVSIDFQWDEETPVFDEILEGLSPTLLWSKETQKTSILSKKIKDFYPPPEFLYYIFHLADGRIGVFRIFAIENANIIFWVFPNQKKLFKQLRKSAFLYVDSDMNY